MNPEVRQVSGGFALRVNTYAVYDVNGYRFHTTQYQEQRPNRRTTNNGVCTCSRSDGVDYYGRIEEIYELEYHGCKPLKPVIFKCHWFDTSSRGMRQNKNLGLVEVKQSSVYPGHDVYIVAQQTTQVYYLSYPCKTDKRLQGWDVVYKVSPHGKLPAPSNEDYHILDPNTYDGEFFQEDGLEGMFEIDLTSVLEMEVDNEMVVDDDTIEEVQNDEDLRLLERLRLGNSNDDDDTVPPLEYGVEFMDMRDSDDEYDPDIPDHYEYF